MTRGYSTGSIALTFNQVMLDVIVEQQADIPLLMKPLRWQYQATASDFRACRPRAPCPAAYDLRHDIPRGG